MTAADGDEDEGGCWYRLVGLSTRRARQRRGRQRKVEVFRVRVDGSPVSLVPEDGRGGDGCGALVVGVAYAALVVVNMMYKKG